MQTRFGEQLDLASTRSQEGMRSIHDHLFNVQQLASRLTRLQMKALFPDNRVFAECVDMGSNTTKIKQVYELMESEIARLDKDASEYSSHVFAQMVRARRMAEVLKVPTMIVSVKFTNTTGLIFSRYHSFTISIIVGTFKTSAIRRALTICANT